MIQKSLLMFDKIHIHKSKCKCKAASGAGWLTGQQEGEQGGAEACMLYKTGVVEVMYQDQS